MHDREFEYKSLSSFTAYDWQFLRAVTIAQLHYYCNLTTQPCRTSVSEALICVARYVDAVYPGVVASKSDLFQPRSNRAAMAPVSAPAVTRALWLAQTHGAQDRLATCIRTDYKRW